MGYVIKQNQTARPLVFLMVDSADHVTGKTGLSPTVTISKDGGAFGSPSGAVSEIGNGWYKVAGDADDADTLGPLLLHATGSGADPVDDRFDVVAYNPEDGVRLGLSALPNAAAAAAGGLPVSVGGGLALDTLLGKLNVAGTLAHSGAAATYKADVSALALQATLSAVKTVTDALPDSGALNDLALARKLVQNRKEFDLDNSKIYLWNDAGDAREYEADLTDSDGDAVTTSTQGPINCSRWTAV